MQTVRRRARAAGKNVSAYVRSAILPEGTEARATLRRDKKTGYLVSVPAKGMKPLTPERVKELLADFP